MTVSTGNDSDKKFQNGPFYYRDEFCRSLKIITTLARSINIPTICPTPLSAQASGFENEKLVLEEYNV